MEKEGNMFQTKNQDKSPETDISEVSGLPDRV